MKTIIVTGGSRGIGASIVKELANKDYNIVLNYNNSEEQAKQIQKELLEKNIKIELVLIITQSLSLYILIWKNNMINYLAPYISEKNEISSWILHSKVSHILSILSIFRKEQVLLHLYCDSSNCVTCKNKHPLRGT